MLFALIKAFISLAIIIMMYVIFVPFIYHIGNVVMALGAPQPMTLMFRSMLIWGFYIFGIAVLVILLGKVYKKTHDTGINEYQGFK